MSIPPPPPPAPGNQPPSWQPGPPQQPGFAQPYQPGHPHQPGSQQQWETPPAMEKTKAPIGWVAGALAIVCAVAPALPWATGDGESVNGFAEVGVDDQFVGAAVVLFAGVAAILFIVGAAVRNRPLHIIGAVSAGFAAFMPLADLGRISDLEDLGLDISPGVGLFIALAAGAAAMVCGIIAAVQTKKRPVGYAG